MAVAGSAPRVFLKCTKGGMPYMAVLASIVWIPLCYLNVGAASGQVFNWFINITNTANFLSWICCAIIFLRWRKAIKVQSFPVSNLPYTSKLQPYGSWVVIVAFTLAMLLNGMEVFFYGKWDTATFLSAYIGIPFFFAFYLGHKFTAGRQDMWAIRPSEVDLYSGLDEIEAAETPAPVFTGVWGKVRDVFW